uniref:DNA excision repair protein ERCC-6-like n=1 Tax=Periophthalmus magnuspinnatus TaxID=409849 RepID=A0A3B4BGL7_9GOBI
MEASTLNQSYPFIPLSSHLLFFVCRLVQEAKAAGRGGDMHKALTLFEKAYLIRPSDKLKSRIQKVKEFLSEEQSEDEDDEEFVDVNGCGLLLFKELHHKLYDYQKQGVAFLYSLYRDRRKGGILADDMGLGKTIQVISFLSGMYDAEHVKFTMLIVPTSLITNWTKEFAKWTPGMRVKEFHGTSKSERTKNLEKVQRRGGVIITTYNMLLTNWQILSAHNGREFTWDYMILDEAHKIKSTATKTAKSASAIPSKNRVLLTGTPVQNNLREMWALFDFACQGALLGTAKTFKVEYENPITRAREKDATPGEKALGSRMSENLMARIKPHFLRRTKAEVQKSNSPEQETRDRSANAERDETDSEATMPKLTRKNDLIVWTYLSAVQEDIYRQFISLDHIKELLMTTKSPLAQLTILKKLCDHPRLLSAGSMAKLGLDDHYDGDSEGDTGHDITNVPDDTLISESGKMVFLFALLERLREEGHRTLVFAHYRKVLDILERILKNRGFKVMRMDGTITHTAERERRITLFQKDQSYTVFLLTTQVGGVGITLTAANRVVIYDPSWNPATDAQAVDRAYRIGQKENVVIYRLITCGTVEEKIYRRQVFKDSLIRQNTGDKKNPFRYFSKQELKELFTLQDTKSSTTQMQLQALHSRQRCTDAELDEHIAHLHAMEMFGISDHDLMFSVNVNQEEALEDQEAHRYIEGRVQKAQELMKAECNLQTHNGDVSMNDFEAWQNDQNANTSMVNGHENVLEEMENVDCSMNNLVIEDSIEEVMDTSAQNLEWKSEVQNGVKNVIEDLSENRIVENLKIDQSTGDSSLSYFTADDNEKPQRGKADLSDFHDTPLKNKQVSMLQASFKSENRSSSSYVMDSLEGDFNLQLDDDKVNASANDSIVATVRKKRVARIYSDDEDEEEEGQENPNGKDFEGSFHMLGASTPKAAGTLKEKPQCISCLQKVVCDVESAELSSGERMERLAAQTEEEEKREDYEMEVKRGRECLTRGQREQALGHFLRAIDMKPGDAEIQLLTIQLYRQLSQNKY